MKQSTTLILGALTLLALSAVVAVRLFTDPVPGLDGGARVSLLDTLATTDLTTLLWYVFAAGAVVCAGVTALHPKIIYAGLALLGTFGAIAALFIYLSADFLAVTQVAVYIGGILVLILFAVMLTNKIGVEKTTNPSVGLPVAAGLSVTLLGLLIFALTQTAWNVTTPEAIAPTTATLGHALLTTYLLPFEVASVLLVAVIIGAVIIVRKEVRPEADELGPSA